MKESVFPFGEDSRKKEIIDTSLRIMDRYGIKGLTVARIAQEVGFTESALYRHFRSKKEIISLILKDADLAAQSQIKEIKETPKNAVDQLKMLLRNHLEFLKMYPGLFKIIYSDEIHIGETSLLQKLDHLISNMVAGLEEILEKGKKSKIFKSDVDVTVGAIHFLGIVQTAFSYWTIKNRKSSLVEIGDHLLTQFFTGIKA
ncbi:TetR/AcrR family transcriptional regulator [bacterium]|nr:TetR/AcrR family transcriptional regulator [bacterium]